MTVRALFLAAAAVSLASPARGADPTAWVDHQILLTPAQLQALGAKLPEAPGAARDLASGAWSPELRLTQDAQVRLSWIGTPGGSRPSLGAFTYVTDGDLQMDHAQLLLPDASGHSLAPGVGASVRHGVSGSTLWPAGTQIGLFLVADGWTDEPTLQDGDLAGDPPRTRP